MTLICRTPTRISFGGGGTDLASYYEKYGGFVVSATINKHIYSILELRDDNKIQIISSDLQLIQNVEDFYGLKYGEGLDIPVAVLKHFNIQRGMNLFMASEVPPGSGLGSSGAVCINLVKLIDYLEKLKMSKSEIAETAYKIGFYELQMPIGKQDEYAAAFGGINYIGFEKEKTSIEPLKISDEIKKRLEDDLMLFYTGRTRISASILSSQNKATKEREPAVIEALHNTKKIAIEMKKTIESGDLRHFGELLHQSWLHKKNFAKGISNETIDRAYDLALKNGAIGGKLTGAGGGGYLMIYCEKKNQREVNRALQELGLKRLDFKFELKGATILNGE